MKMEKSCLILASVLSCWVLFTACSPKEDEASDIATVVKTGEPVWIGDTLKYDTNSLVNNGEGIILTIWTDPEIVPFYKDIADKYTAMHPNVKIEISEQPWGDYWTKLPLTLQTGRGPDIYRAHDAYIGNLINYTRPLDETILPLDQVMADFPTATELLIDGKLYSLPLGATFPGIYYNKTMWADVGLTEADIPTTWDEFAEVGKKLVKTDDNGNVVQYGFSVDNAFQNFGLDVSLVKGEATFEEDLYHWNLDHDAMYETIDMLDKFLNEDSFLLFEGTGAGEDQFGQKQVAMMFQMSWVGGYFNGTYPDVDWGFFLLPTDDDEIPASYGHKLNEWTMSVSTNADDATAAVAFDFLKYYAAEEETFLAQALRIGVIPSKLSMQSPEKIKSLENISKGILVADRFVYPGLVPTSEVQQNAMDVVASEIFINGADPKEMIVGLEKELHDTAVQNDFDFKSSQSMYKYYDELNK